MTDAYCDRCGKYRPVRRRALGPESWNFADLCASCATDSGASASTDRTPATAGDSPAEGDQCTDGATP